MVTVVGVMVGSMVATRLPGADDFRVPVNSKGATADTAGMDDATSAALTAMVVGDALGAIPLLGQAGVLVLMLGCAGWAVQVLWRL